MAKIKLLFVRIWPIYDVSCEQRAIHDFVVKMMIIRCDSVIKLMDFYLCKW